jgi:hypothetical protein
MLIRFSDQENYTEYQPTSVNTAGTFRIDDGTQIIGAIGAKDYILVLTDTAAYTMQYVGAPYTFSIRKVGSNCGLMSPHSVVFVDGVVYWMDDAGSFNAYNGTVVKNPCSVEDFVFTTTNPGDLGFNYNAGRITYASHNSLFSEIHWFYASSSATEIDRCVTYNYEEKIGTQVLWIEHLILMLICLINLMLLLLILQEYLLFLYTRSDKYFWICYILGA